MQANSKQLSFCDVFSNVERFFQYDKPKFISLFEEYINISSLIPQSFTNHYYASTGHPRDFSLSSMLSALIIKSFLSIPDTSVFLNILALSHELRSLCGFTRIPHASQFSRFKMDFENDLHDFFNKLVDITEPICKQINKELASIMIADTTGFEAYVKENNPKYFDTILRNSKKFSKNNPDFNAHLYACSKMPKESSVNPDVKLSYINGHYCYSIKTALVTNALGIIRHIDFYEDDSIDISKSTSPSEAKDEYDAKSLIPVLKNFFSLHKSFHYKYFLGDAGFDAVDNYKYLYKDLKTIPIIPFRRQPAIMPGFNESGIPTCPKDPSLAMKFDGITREKNRADRLKWLCPKSKKVKVNGKTKYILSCDNPCSDSPCGKVFQVPIDNDYRTNIAVPRDSEEWIKLYKLRTIIERTNFMVKYPMALKYTKLKDTTSLKSEVIISGIVQQIAVLISSALNETSNILSIKSLVA